MRFFIAACLLTTCFVLIDAQSAAQNRWCGSWAGSPSLFNVPHGLHLPENDTLPRDFVGRPLIKLPFQLTSDGKPIVQLPQIWTGTGEFLCDQRLIVH